MPESRPLLRLRDESPGGPWFGAECTTLSPVVDVTYQTANASKKGADIDAGHVAVASNSVRPHEEKDVMNDQTGKLFVVESEDALRETLVTVLRDSGYEVSADYRAGMNSVLAFGPDLVILGADPPQLDCCDLLSEIKGSKHTRNIRVVMLVHGSSAERTRGLDLAADDALSLPLDPAELLSRIRSQLRSKEIAEELWERLRLS